MKIRHNGLDITSLQRDHGNIPDLKPSVLDLASLSETGALALPFRNKDERKLLKLVLEESKASSRRHPLPPFAFGVFSHSPAYAFYVWQYQRLETSNLASNPSAVKSITERFNTLVRPIDPSHFTLSPCHQK